MPAFRRMLLLMVLASAPLAAADRVHLERQLAALTNPRASVHQPAMAELVRLGAEGVADLVVLAGDREAGVRQRCAEVLSGIRDARAFAALVRLAADPETSVRQTAALGLGVTADPAACDPLLRLLGDGDGGVSEAAALALGNLGEARALAGLCRAMAQPLPAAATMEARQQAERQRRSLRTAVEGLLLRPTTCDETVRQLASLDGAALHHLITATAVVGDPRLAPALATLLRSDDRQAAVLAAVSLSANGDGRALEALCALAAGDGPTDLREAAAASLRRLTGHEASAGAAWSLWWRDHAGRVAALRPRDEFIAALHDPARTATAAELARFTVEDLRPLLAGALGEGVPYWPALALRALRADDITRWASLLLGELAAEPSQARQVALVVLIDELGMTQAIPDLSHRLSVLDRDDAGDGRRHPQASLRAALRLALDSLRRRK